MSVDLWIAPKTMITFTKQALYLFIMISNVFSTKNVGSNASVKSNFILHWGHTHARDLRALQIRRSDKYGDPAISQEPTWRPSDPPAEGGIVAATPSHNGPIFIDRDSSIIPSLLEMHVNASDTTLNS